MMKARSLWEHSTERPEFPSLRQDMKTDVLIIGGGLAGILCAYMLQKAGVDYVLAEGNRICSGVTGCTTAKITLQHGLIYDKLIRTFGLEAAQMYLHANQQALESYRKICTDLDCGFTQADNFVYALDRPEKLDREMEALLRLGVSAQFEQALPLPVAAAGAVRVNDQALFHPLRFAYSIARGLRIFENTRVLALAPQSAITENGRIQAKKTIVATHFPFLNRHGSYFLKLYQHRSYVLALENAPIIQGMYVDESDAGLSFRPHGDLLLLGGGGHRTGKNGGGWAALHAFAQAHYPGAQLAAQWATQDCMTLDGMPYIGMYSQRTPDLYVTTGFNKWGMTSAMAGAILLRDMILDRTPEWAGLFSPSRSMLHPQLAVNAGESALNFLSPTAPRCPHMGCALKYNAQEHSWDCPCHGSRFTESGKLIDNPAVESLKKT